MATMHERSIVVFGGTGFLGRRVVRRLRKAGFFVRIASRHPDRGHRLFGFDDPQLCHLAVIDKNVGSMISNV
jgi:NADH dehydrogenase